MSGLSGALLACVLGALMLAGAGHPLARLLLPVGMSGPATTLALGFVAVGVAGGLLNLLGVATRPVVLGCLCAGVLAALAQRVWRSMAVPRLHDIAPLLPVVLMAGVYAWLVLPAGAFNPADDLHGYLPRPLHMLATGSVSGGPFDALGADDLGLQAFLQGLVLTVAPFTWAPLFDDVLALLLAGLLLDAWLRRLQAGPWWRALSMLLLVLLPTQSINLSASHSAVAMTLLMLLAMAALHIAPGVARRENLLLGLAAGTLALLKLTFLPFAAAAMLLALATRADGSARERLTGAVYAAAGAGLVMLPWLGVLLLHLPPLDLAAATPTLPEGVGALPSLLDTGALHWGGTPLQFALLAGAVLLTLLAAGFARVQKRDDGATSALAMAWVSLLPAVLGAAWLADLGHAVRYYCPLLVALAPATLALLARLPARRVAMLALLPWLAATVALNDQFRERLERAARAGTLVSYPVGEQPRASFAPLLGDELGHYLRAVQARTPEGAALMVLSGLAMHLDHSRQPVWVVADTGLLTAWSPLQIGASPEKLRERLRATGVRYVLLQLRGLGARDLDYYRWASTSGAPALERIGAAVGWLVPTLVHLAEQSPRLFQDGSLVLFELRSERARESSE